MEPSVRQALDLVRFQPETSSAFSEVFTLCFQPFVIGWGITAGIPILVQSFTERQGLYVRVGGQDSCLTLSIAVCFCFCWGGQNLLVSPEFVLSNVVNSSLICFFFPGLGAKNLSYLLVIIPYFSL